MARSGEAKSAGNDGHLTQRTIAILAGSLFIIADVAGVSSVLATDSILKAPDYLEKISANQDQVMLGALLVLAMGFALALVPIVIYPVFRRFNKALAVGYVVFRGALETFTYIALAVSWLLLLTLSRDYVKAGSPDGSYFEAMGALLTGAGDWVVNMTAIVFSIGAFMYCFVFYQSRLVPRWLSAWGLVGAVLYLAAPLTTMFGHASVFGFLVAPLAIQEIALAIWLIVKGFDRTVIASGPVEAKGTG
jgi:hypothetical protein